MKTVTLLLIALAISLVVIKGIDFINASNTKKLATVKIVAEPIQIPIPTLTPTPIPTPTTTPTPTPIDKLPETALPEEKLLLNGTHVFQSFNNCGPAALSMTLSYFGISESQAKLGDILRPYQNTAGINDDKSVTLAELASLAKNYNLVPFHRPNGNYEILKKFLSNDLPVITRTWLKPDQDIGHFRVVKGYDNTLQQIIQDDSLQGKNLSYSYEDFELLWKKFNFEYLVLVPTDKISIIKSILGSDFDERTAWETAAANARNQLAINSDDVYARLNLVVAYYNTQEYESAVKEFEKIETKLSFRDLWYQIEPIKAYFELGNYTKVFAMTDAILAKENKAFSELYILRGRIYKIQGENELARGQFEQAVLYNKNLLEAKDLLSTL